MSDAEKIAAFDALAIALTNRWHHGRWSWWCCTPAGGESKHATQAEAVADLVTWANRTVKLKAKRKQPCESSSAEPLQQLPTGKPVVPTESVPS